MRLLIAHRGGVVDAHRSENSFKALDEAIHRGYTHVEIDARITADGHVICFHNDDLMEEAGVAGKISTMKRDGVTQIVLTRSGENIPTFEAYCAHCANRIGVMIDLKGCPDEHILTYAQEIEDALTQHNLLNDAYILINKTPQNNQDKIARLFLGKVKISYRQSLAQTQEAASQDADFANKFYIFNHGADFTADDVTGFQKLGLTLIVSINTHHYKTGDPQQQGEQHVKDMIAYGIDGLQIDSCYDIVFT